MELELATEYLKLDADPIARLEITTLVNQKNWPRLQELLGSRLQFGTSGLRAEMGAGYSRMNNLTVIQATQGIVAYYLKNSNIIQDGAVIGHDHRHGSIMFAKLTAAAFLIKGIKVYFFPDNVHTPLVPFAIENFKCTVGIMITASHNPKTDNGYKVYGSNGSQIITPLDKFISSSIKDNLVPWTWDTSLVETNALSFDPTNEVVPLYFEKLRHYSQFSILNCNQNVKFGYSAMHGVGHVFAKQAFETFNLAPFYPVLEQISPDPDFSTVDNPNPEEIKSLDLSIKAANSSGASVIFINDPDADRLAVGEKQANGEWRVFTGNEIGCMMASFLIERLKLKNGGVLPKNTAMLTTAVSSQMLSAIAKKDGILYEETLTGFKWLGNSAAKLELAGYEVIFAYEEAIGFMVPGIVHDKDGVSALAIFAEWTNEIYRLGLTLSSRLNELLTRYGYFASRNGYYICRDQVKTSKIFDTIRFGAEIDAKKFNYPKEIGSIPVTYIRDLTAGYDSSQLDLRPILPCSESSQMLTIKLSNGCCITLRTSGTEPKIKYYVEMSGVSADNVKSALDTTFNLAIDQLLQPVYNELA